MHISGESLREASWWAAYEDMGEGKVKMTHGFLSGWMWCHFPRRRKSSKQQGPTVVVWGLTSQGDEGVGALCVPIRGDVGGKQRREFL